MTAIGPELRRAALAAVRSRGGRLVLAGVAAAIAAIVAVGFLVAPGSTEPPATGAAAVVPGNALAYVHFSTDRRRPAVRSALRLAARFPTFPLLSGVVTGRLAAIASGIRSVGGSSSYRSDIRPWLGSEAAIAFLNTTASTAGSEIVLDVGDRSAARGFIARVARPAGSYHRVELFALRTGTEIAFVRHYLVLGQRATVYSSIDAAAGRLPSLARNPAYVRAAAGEPASRVLDCYFSAAGITRLLAPQGGVIGALGALLYQPSELGSTVSVSATGSVARLYVHTAFVRSTHGQTGRAFTPSLAADLPSGSLLALDVTGLDRVAPRVLNAGATAGIAGRLGPLLQRLGSALAAEGVNLGQLEALFGGETAVALAPARGGLPALVVLARTTQERKAREDLANLEVPLSNLFPAPKQGSGVVPEFSTHQVAGVAVHQLALAPGLTLDYAVFRNLIVVSTSLAGIAAVAHHSRSLKAQPAYSQTLPGQPRPVTALVFADFSQLLRLAERTGLTRSARYQALQPDLDLIRAVGVQTTRGRAGSTARITLQIP